MTTTAPANAARSPLRALRRAGRTLWWYLREVSGEADYERYVAHVRRHSPDAPVKSRREFERCRTDEQEADPRKGFRCC
ncbi:YbdD/YjiX family protein [Streptomyces sp. NPDC059506]|uniref:YbdD/YjiX family protein n=1 Tax=Streptomyces TaxID=1883 RepID=UPI000CA76A5B|nr:MULTISPECIES: YbdD/YjiX family protein [unclassified Streptomyces]MCZ2527903.1 YbdD/YjiX family protein [Streptomyces sp. HB2AG]PLW73141.1 hypothetical protein C0036_08810 [Streptomyces sp. DJ]QMV21814.1 putative selenoprotein [Streptomyces sp. SCUT-3]